MSESGAGRHLHRNKHRLRDLLVDRAKPLRRFGVPVNAPGTLRHATNRQDDQLFLLAVQSAALEYRVANVRQGLGQIEF